MYIRVDSTDEEPIEGFSYHNQDGETESVEIDFFEKEFVRILPADQGCIDIYVKDIPNLILALQKAYEHLGGDNE